MYVWGRTGTPDFATKGQRDAEHAGGQAFAETPLLEKYISLLW